MAQDHFVAQTYLRKFGDPNRGYLMHGYRKVPPKDFPCRPRDVCREWDGDLNPAFITNRPELRGDFRALCEPHWGSALDSLLKGKLGREDKFIMAAMAATLMTCTPAWRRLSTEIYGKFTTGTAIASYELAIKAGATPPLEAEDIALLRSGEIVLDVDPRFLEAKNTRALLIHAWLIYNQPWMVLYNGTDHPFVTSDNPLALLYPNPKGGVTRFLPVTPTVCLEIPFVTDLAPIDPANFQFDLDRPPQGGISYAQMTPDQARRINRLLVQCAEDLVLTSQPSDGIRTLVAKYAQWGLDQDFIEQPVDDENAVLHGTVLHVRERARILQP